MQVERNGVSGMSVGTGTPVARGRAAKTGRSSSPRGVALIMVIWVTVFVSIAITAFAFAMRTELYATRNFKEEAEAFALAEAGVAWAVARVVNEGATGGGAVPPSAGYSSGSVALGRGTYHAVVTPGGGRLNINRTPVDVLRRLLQQTGVRDARVLDGILDALQDWRDSDGTPRASGAEEDYYRSLAHPYFPRNGDFEAVEELLLVRGLTREIFFGNVTDPARLAELLDTSPEDRTFRPGEYLGLRPFLTVSGPGQVNVMSASRDVLAAAGLSGTQVAELIESRTLGPFRGQLPRGAAGIAFTTASELYSIESVGSLTGSSFVRRIAATIAKERAGTRPRVRVLTWREGV